MSLASSLDLFSLIEGSLASATKASSTQASAIQAYATGVSAASLSLLDQQYEDAVQNLRGLLGRLRAQQKQRMAKSAARLDPTSPNYRILGSEGVDPYAERPLSVENKQEAQRLQLNCAQVVARLALATHSRLLLQGLKTERLYKHLVVGLSGGPDSTLVLVLAAVMQHLFGYQVTAVHCIHGLDPDDAIWLEHNQKLCTLLDVELKTPQLNIVYGEGRSPEEVSRAERYRALLQELSESSCLVLGHQADDQIENFLLALKRGAGPNGLAGMSVVTSDQRGTLLRPLLALHKSEIEQILTELNVPFVYDLSNSYLKFERNFMRLKIMPALRERFAGIDKAILRSQQLCSYEHELAERYAVDKMKACVVSGGVIGVDGECLDFSLLDLSDKAIVILVLRAWFYRVLGLYLELNQLESCYELMLKPHDKNGEVLLSPSNFVATTFLHYLCLYRPFSAESEQALSKVKAKAAQGRLVPLPLHHVELCSQKKPRAPEEPQQLAQGQHLAGRILSTWHLGEVEYSLLQLLHKPTVLSDTSTVSRDSAALYKEGIGGEVPQSEIRVEVGSDDPSFSILEGSYFSVGRETSALYLDFAYAQSFKMHPKLRQHSREIKKLMIENKVAPWIRPWLPLVCDEQGKVLACAGLWAQREDVPLHLNKKVATYHVSACFSGGVASSGGTAPALVSGRSQYLDEMQSQAEPQGNWLQEEQGVQAGQGEDQILLALAVRRCSKIANKGNV